MSQRTHLISVFCDTMAWMRGNAIYLFWAVVELAINKQTLVLESEPISIPSATFNRPERVIVSEHRCNI